MLDLTGLRPGDDLIAFMSDGIAEAHTILLVYSCHTAKATFQQAEIRAATNWKLKNPSFKCIVIKLDKSDLPPLLASLIHLSVDPTDHTSYAQFLSNLLSTLRRDCLASPTSSTLVATAEITGEITENEESTKSKPQPTSSAPISHPEVIEDRGPMAIDNPFYVERDADAQVLDFFGDGGISAALRGGVRMGKSSLARRVCNELALKKWRVVRLEIGDDLEKSDFADGHQFLRAIAVRILRQLEQDVRPLTAFDREKSGSAFRDFMELLGAQLGDNRRLVIFLDQMDALAGTQASSVAVSGLRSWHSAQSLLGKKSWARLLVAHTITPKHVGPEGSIFTVAEKIELSDFTPRELAQLVKSYGRPPAEADVLAKVLGGHPFLSRAALNALANERITLRDLAQLTHCSRDLFKHHLEDLAKQFDKLLSQAFLKLATGQPLDSRETYFTLFAIGVVKDTPWRKAEIRCELYRKLLPEFLP